jgi:hypothetical protein
MFRQKKTNKAPIRLTSRPLLVLFLFAILFGLLNINEANANDYADWSHFRELRKQYVEELSKTPQDLAKIKDLEIRLKKLEEINVKHNNEVDKARKEEAATLDQRCFYVSGIVPHLNLVECAKDLFVLIGGIAVWIGAKILWLANYIFALSLKISILDFHTYASLPPVNVAWKVLRDLVNMFFVVILLYAAFSAVFNISNNWKKTVAQVIIVALLINFSIIIPKIVIDASNILALQAYNSLGEPMTPEHPDMRDVGKTITSNLDGVIKQLSGGDPSDDPSKAVTQSTRVDKMAVIVGKFGAAILLVIMAFILAAGAIMFLARTITLVMLIIFSPIVFLALMAPYFNSYAKQWRESLISQSIFAPAFLIPFTAVMAMISYAKNINIMDGPKDSPILSTLVFFILINGFMVYTLTIAKKFGAYGAGRADNLLRSGLKKAGKLALGSTVGLGLMGAGFAAREFVGRLGRKIAESGGRMTEEYQADHPIRAKLSRGLYNFASNFKGGLKESYSERVARLAEEAAKAKKAENEVKHLARASDPVVKKRLENMDAKTLASRAYEARKQGLTELAEKIENEAKSRGGDIYDEFLSKLAHEKAKGAINAEDIILNDGRKISAKNTKEGLDVNNRDTTLKSITNKASNEDLFSADEAGQFHEVYKNVNKDDKAAVIRAIVAGLAQRNDGGKAIEILYKTAKTAEDRALIATEISNRAKNSSISNEERDRLQAVINSQQDISRMANRTVPKDILNKLIAIQNGKEPYNEAEVKTLLDSLTPKQFAQLPPEILTDPNFIKHADIAAAEAILTSDISREVREKFAKEVEKLATNDTLANRENTSSQQLLNFIKSNPRYQLFLSNPKTLKT